MCGIIPIDIFPAFNVDLILEMFFMLNVKISHIKTNQANICGHKKKINMIDQTYILPFFEVLQRYRF